MTTGFDDKASRRDVLRASLASASIAVASIAVAGTAVTGRAQAQSKIAQKLVQYVEVSKKPNQSCANCAQFLPPNSCKIVQGEIAPGGWCVSWGPAPKTQS